MRVSSRSLLKLGIVLVSWAFLACASPAFAEYDRYEVEWVRDQIRRIDQQIQEDQNRLQDLRADKHELAFGGDEDGDEEEVQSKLNRLNSEIRRQENSIQDKKQQKVEYRKRLAIAKD